MRKYAFLAALESGLSCLPQSDREERLSFYSEMIDDRMEEGLAEEDAVAAIGSVEDVLSQILSETPLTTLVKERVKPKRALRVWEILLLVLGSPIWLSLAIAAFAVVLALYIVLWSLLISLWAVAVVMAGCATCGVAAGGILIYQGNGFAGIAMIGGGLVCTGLSIFLFYGCKAATKGVLLLTKKIALGIKSCFVKKEKA